MEVTNNNNNDNNNNSSSNNNVDENNTNHVNNKNIFHHDITHVTNDQHPNRIKEATASTRSKPINSSEINNHHSNNKVASIGDTTDKNAGEKAAVAATRATTSSRKRSLDDIQQVLDTFNKKNNDYYGRPSVEAIDDSSDKEDDYNSDSDYKMITKGDTLYILPNTSIRLECRFKTAAWYNFNFWDNPIVWYKVSVWVEGWVGRWMGG